MLLLDIYDIIKNKKDYEIFNIEFDSGKDFLKYVSSIRNTLFDSDELENSDLTEPENDDHLVLSMVKNTIVKLEKDNPERIRLLYSFSSDDSINITWRFLNNEDFIKILYCKDTYICSFMFGNPERYLKAIIELIARKIRCKAVDNDLVLYLRY